jgi:hypothetical protein
VPSKQGGVMKGGVSRRSVLAATCHALAGTAAGQMLAGLARAQDAASRPPAALSMTVLFPGGGRAKFDADKYVRKHLPLLKEIYGGSVERIEVRTAASSSTGMPPAMLAMSTMWILDVPAFGQRLAANAERINKDLDAASRGNRLVTVERVALELGEPRGTVSQGDQVFSLLYPAKPMAMGPLPAGRGGPPPRGGGGPPPETTFDTRYFVEEYLPRLYALYGEEAVRRLEATLGQDQGGQKATYVGAYHLLIRDRGAFDRKSGSVFTELQQDAGRLTNIMIPMLADMRVNAIA